MLDCGLDTPLFAVASFTDSRDPSRNRLTPFRHVRHFDLVMRQSFPFYAFHLAAGFRVNLG